MRHDGNVNDLFAGRLAVGVDRVQRNHRGRPVGLFDAPDSVAHPERLHQRGRRRRGSRGPNAAGSERVHTAGVPRHRRGPWVFLVQTVQQHIHTSTTIVLGADQPRYCKYR